MGHNHYSREKIRSKSLKNVDPQEKLKDWCRKIIAFMCTQVGVGALIFGYTLVGALSFQNIEQKWENNKVKEVTRLRQECLVHLYKIVEINNIFEKHILVGEMDKELKLYQKSVVDIFHHGYDDRKMTDVWSFPAALMYSLSVITMIGYGNLVPKTPYGKLATVIYALFGIPLYVLYFLNFGDALAGGFRWVYRRLYRCSTEKFDNEQHKRIIVPSTACLWVICAYVITGAIIFGTWENWGFLDSIYFCVTSLCKLGLGDFVPGANIDASNHGNQTKLVINFGYILFGIGLVAMCYNLMREEIREKVKEMKRIITMVENIGLGPLRLLNVPGFEQRTNDIIYSCPQTRIECNDIVVYFGGDVQDFTENMLSHRDNKNYIDWNLENTALLLRQHFSFSHIVVIHPNRMEYKTFSCYDNFVPCNQCGVPSHTSTNNGLTHLKTLICSISNRLKSMTREELKHALDISRKAIIREESLNTTENDTPIHPNFDSIIQQFDGSSIKLEEMDIKLVGFSKGCIVLNQFLYEYHYYKTFTTADSNEMKFNSKIKHMYWLDGGHSGGKNTWITSRPLLETLASLDISIDIHVTPYQITDERRPWIKKEEKTFSDVLIKLGAQVNRKVHFANQTTSLVAHFNVLKVFVKNSDDN